MSEKINEVMEILPQASRNIPVSDDKFLFFLTQLMSKKSLCLV